MFGSRVDPAARGGDIDLYLEVTPPLNTNPASLARALRLELYRLLGEQKIDLVIDDGRNDLGAFGEIVRETKVDLWTNG